MSNEHWDNLSSHSTEARGRRSPGVLPSKSIRNKTRDETKDRAAEFPTLAKHREARMSARKGSVDSSGSKMTAPGAPDIVKEWPPSRSSDDGARSRVNAFLDLPRSPKKPFGRGPTDNNLMSRVGGGGDGDFSTHSVSSTASVSQRRRSILSQSPQVPPAFRNMDRSNSPRARKSTMGLDMDKNTSGSQGRFLSSSSHDSKSQSSDNRPRRSKRPPIAASNPTTSLESGSKTGPLYSREPKNNDSPGVKRTEMTQAESTELMVNLIDSSIVNGDECNVATYNAILESVANSESPDAQKGLDVLATMAQHGVAPNDHTWALINMCSKVSDGNSDDDDDDGSNNDEHDNIVDSGRLMERTAVKGDESEKSDERQFQKIRTLSLYGHVGQDAKSDPGNPPRRPWRMEQDLSLLPPAFRSSILAMLRRKSQRNLNDPAAGYSNSPRSIARRNTHPTIIPSLPAATDHREPNVFPSVADRKKIFMSFSVNSDLPSPKITVESEPMPNESTATDDPFSRIFAQHGVVKYMRPDGHGNAARQIERGENGSQGNDTDSFAEDFEKILDSSDISTFVELLATIANSSVPDKANRAGKVLKKMKTNGIAVDDRTRALLQECAEIKEKPKEVKPHELDYVEQANVQVPSPEVPTTPNPIIIKRVRFAERHSFRIIRRRRSIGSNERWDDPLTPPKRVTPPVDLAPARFATGLRDDRPAPPRRSNSLSSLLSASSHSARSDDSSESADSLFDDDQLTDRFKLPFTDSPEASERKFAAKKSSRPKLVPKSPKRQRHSSSPQLNTPLIEVSSSKGMPLLPVRRRSSIQGGTVSPVQNQELLSPVVEEVTSPNPSVPVPPVDDSILYTTPPSTRKPVRRRRSISGIERRSDFPLTPPRRVSAPLEIFIAQEALKSKLASEARQKAQSAVVAMTQGVDNVEKPKPPVNLLVKSVPTPLLDGVLSATSVAESSAHPLPSTDEPIQESNHPKTKAQKRSTGTTSAFQVPAIFQQSKATETKSRAPVDAPGPRPSSLMKHSEKVREHWKLLKFRDKYQGKGPLDDNYDPADSTVAAVDSERDNALPTDGHKIVSTNDGSRKTRPDKHSSTKKSLSTKGNQHVDELWHRVLQKDKETILDGKGEVTRPSRRDNRSA